MQESTFSVNPRYPGTAQPFRIAPAKPVAYDSMELSVLPLIAVKATSNERGYAGKTEAAAKKGIRHNESNGRKTHCRRALSFLW